MTSPDENITLLTDISPEEKERFRKQWEYIEVSQKIATGFLDTYKEGELSFRNLCENSWRVLKDNTDLAGVRNRYFGWVVKEALESRRKRTKKSSGRSKIPRFVIETTKTLVRLAKTRDHLPLTRATGSAFEAIANCWVRWGVVATPRTVENWYYNSPKNRAKRG